MQNLTAEEKKSIVEKLRSRPSYDEEIEANAKPLEMEILGLAVLNQLEMETKITVLEDLQFWADYHRRTAENLEKIIEKHL